MLTQAELKEYLYFNPESGIFTHIKTRSGAVKTGSIAGYSNPKGYVTIEIKGSAYQAHRLAWLYTYGAMPNLHIDHINQIKSDNRIINLREATNAENKRNVGIKSTNKTGFKGVSFHKMSGKYQSHACFNGKGYYLGLYLTPEEASNAYQDFTLMHYGEFHPDNAAIKAKLLSGEIVAGAHIEQAERVEIK